MHRQPGGTGWRVKPCLVYVRMSLPPVSPQPKYTKRPWRPEEDNKLREMIERLGIPEISGGKGSVKTGGVQWTDIAKEIPGRVAKQCRERWRNNLDPSVSRAPWTEEENEILLKRYDHYGSSWAEIASGLPGRPDNGCASRSLTVEDSVGVPRAVADGEQGLALLQPTNGLGCR